METFNVKWSKTIYSSTILVILLFIVITIFQFNTLGLWGLLIIGPIILFVLIYAAYLSPIYMVVTDDIIMLKTLIGRKVFWINDIETIELHKLTGANVRTCGSGGVLGYTGNFYNKAIGKYISYVGNYDQTFLLTLKTGKRYLLSCQNPEEFVKTIKAKIK